MLAVSKQLNREMLRVFGRGRTVMSMSLWEELAWNVRGEQGWKW